MYKMVVITIENFTNAKVHTIKVGNRELFWIRMIDIQNGLGLKKMSDLVRKVVFLILIILQKIKLKNTSVVYEKQPKTLWMILKLSMLVVISWKK